MKSWLMGTGMTLSALGSAVRGDAFTPPAVPLVACDPYFAVWSYGDQLNTARTGHWTGAPNSLTSLIRVDGQSYRLMGELPRQIAPLQQTNLQVLPTRTIYTFQGQGVRVTMTFLTPLLPDDLSVMSWPVTYVSYSAQATDGKPHQVSIYFDAAADLAVNELKQEVQAERTEIIGMQALRIGTTAQPVLQRKGDGVRIDWGHFYLATQDFSCKSRIGDRIAQRDQFVHEGVLVGEDTPAKPTSAADAPVLCLSLDLGEVGDRPVERLVVLAYDDEQSIEYFHQKLRGYWTQKIHSIPELLPGAIKLYPSLRERCEAFDAELMKDMIDVGGEKYAQIGALAYRQCMAANKIVADGRGQPLIFPKENNSNGCIGTVDVIYPMSPQFLLFAPSLAKAMLVSNLAYGASPRWKFPFAPHDLGTYPQANGQVYGGGERNEDNQMPVEESGNMILMIAAVAKVDGNAEFARPYWPTISKWAGYLKEKGHDPDNQLCTDDFAGHLAHNVNLSAKAICALGAYAQLCELMDKKDEAAAYRKLAEDDAARWVKEADDGDHFRLTFDKPGSWSQKYNLAWDSVLDLKLFPAQAIEKEVQFYLKQQNRYGLPLDSRQGYTKLDWITWSASLATRREDFDALIAPIHRWLNETPDRIPMGDWYQTASGKWIAMKARPVVGGVFMPMLKRRDLWKKWSARDALKPSDWAPIPQDNPAPQETSK